MNLKCWFHKLRRHYQESVMNGVTEPGVWCYCPKLMWGDPSTPHKRWFPSDGGGGK